MERKYFGILYLAATLLIGCAHSEKVSKKEKPAVPQTRYKAGDCTYLIDPETGKGKKRDLMIVVNVTETEYTYRWWIFWTNSWAIDSNSRTHEAYERIARERECP